MTKKNTHKQCLECHSTTNLEAPYCEACGYQFRADPAPQAPPSRWKYRLGAIAAGLALAVIVQLIRG